MIAHTPVPSPPKPAKAKAAALLGLVVTALAAAPIVAMTPAPAAGQQTATFQGTVTDQNGSPLSGITVTLLDPYGQVAGTVGTAWDGTYTVQVGVEHGLVLVRFSDPTGQYGSVWHDGVATREDATGVTLASAKVAEINATLSPVEPPASGTVEGMVENREGDPLSRIQVSFVSPEAVALTDTQTGQNGRWSVTLPAGKPVRIRYDDPQGRYRTEWWDDVTNGGGAQDVIPVAGRTVVVDAELALDLSDIPGTIGGRVENEEGDPLPGIQVSFVSPEAVALTDAQTEQDGRWSITLPAGEPVRIRYDDPQGRYLTEWWDDTANGGSAQDVIPVAGQTIQA
ncbi:MAG TPA: carboxypeptidase-like regulatory domain-containing protein, partial [Longimicrobiales bacterium]|nr:carboxypeptidase-like regulatory domain-containing protein [Longimicrobiales bacterium]